MTRTLTLTAVEAQAFSATPVGETFWLVQEGPGDDPIHPEGIWSCEGCGRTYPEYINGCVNDHGSPRGVRLAIPEGPLPPAEFVQACASCENENITCHCGCDGPCETCRIELVGPCPACGWNPHHHMSHERQDANQPATLGHAYAEGQPLPISDVWPDKPPADGLMFLPTGRAAYHKASRPTFWLPGQSKGTEFSLRRLAHYGPPETLVGQWAIALRKVQS